MHTYHRVWRSFSRPAVYLFAGVVTMLWLANAPSGLLGKADAIGYAVCHRIDLRSFHLGDRILPLCARCTGMYLGALLTLTYYLVRRSRACLYPDRKVVAVLILFGLIWAADGLNSYLHLFPSAPHLYPPRNFMRLVAGILIGISLATMVYPVFNQVAWRESLRQPVIRSLKELSLILLLAALLVGAVLSENPLVLYPLALLSALSVVCLLTTVYTMVILTALRRENLANSWRDLVLPLVGGFSMSIIQIGLIDLSRYWLTGTWAGFYL
jgi:uncharacterized membrane protein